MAREILAIDFDGVIHSGPWQGIGVTSGSLIPGADTGIQYLSRTHDIVIHTCRAAHPDGVAAVRAFLHKHGIPFKGITDKKPAAVAYIDDKAIRFIDWYSLMSGVLGLEV